MQAELQKEHRWLQKLVGEWVYEIDSSMGPDQPRVKTTGSESVRSIGGLWMIAEGKGEMPGGNEATTMMTLGYDPQRGYFVGTWIGSMMTYLWVYEGSLDATDKVLTLKAEGPSFVGNGKIAKYEDIIEFKSDDHRTLTSRSLGEDGQWHEFMTGHYRRKA